MALGKNRHGWPMVGFSRFRQGWRFDINEGGVGFVFSLRHRWDVRRWWVFVALCSEKRDYVREAWLFS